MKRPLIFIAAAIAIASFGSYAQAQAPSRVTFARGSDRTILSGTLRGYGDHKSFLIRVRKGQKLTTQNAGNNYITVDITAPKGSTYEPDLAADCHDHHEVDPTAAGDYIIRVTECRKADRWRGTFKLKVIVR